MSKEVKILRRKKKCMVRIYLILYRRCWADLIKDTGRQILWKMMTNRYSPGK